MGRRKPVLLQAQRSGQLHLPLQFVQVRLVHKTEARIGATARNS